MPTSVETVREFVVQLEKTLNARRLYAPNSSTYAEATATVVEKYRNALAAGAFTVAFGSTELLVDRQPVIQKQRREDAFFFPLYRDGLRELRFSPPASLDDFNSLIAIFELKDKELGGADDTVSYLWRADLKTIAHKAIDEIDDIETEGRDDFRDLVTKLAEEISNPRPDDDKTWIDRRGRELGDDYAAMRRALEDHLRGSKLSPQQIEEIRSEMGEGRVQTLVERFIEILLVTVWVPYKSIEPSLIAPILAQLIDSYWATGEFDRAAVLLTHVQAASKQSPNPDGRRSMVDVLARFVTEDRVASMVREFQNGRLQPATAIQLFALVPDAQIWPALLDVLPHLTDDDARGAALSVLRDRLNTNGELLKATLSSFDAARIRAALLLVDDKIEKAYAPQIIGLSSHPDESIRLKGLKAAAMVGGPMALEVLWKAMESDPSKSVRLYAFRGVATANVPGLAARLETLVTSAEFAARPVWEREKYVRLLATVAGPAAEALFESWIPAKRLLWNKKDVETLELALRGLASCGDNGWDKVKAMSTQPGRPGETARKVLDSVSRQELGETAMRPMPTLTDTPLPAAKGPGEKP